MSQQQDDENGRGFRRLIRETKEEAFHARRKLRREQPDPSLQTKLEVAAALSDYRDLLSDFSGEGALETEWEEREVNVDVIDTWLSETVVVERPLNRRGTAMEETELPFVSQVPVEALFAVGKELDAIAKELSFAASVAESHHRTVIDDELIEEVEQWRKQNLE